LFLDRRFSRDEIAKKVEHQASLGPDGHSKDALTIPGSHAIAWRLITGWLDGTHRAD
jgi:hypothetical protein